MFGRDGGNMRSRWRSTRCLASFSNLYVFCSVMLQQLAFRFSPAVACLRLRLCACACAWRSVAAFSALHHRQTQSVFALPWICSSIFPFWYIVFPLRLFLGSVGRENVSDPRPYIFFSVSARRMRRDEHTTHPCNVAYDFENVVFMGCLL